MWVSVLVIVLMLLLSAFFSGMEIAFISKNDIQTELDGRQNRFFGYVSKLFSKHPGQYITTILVGNNVTLVIYSLMMSGLIRGVAYMLGWHDISEKGSILLETIFPSIIVMFLAEYLPKSFVRRNPDFFYKWFASVIYLFYIIFYPIAKLTTWLSMILLQLFGGKRSDDEQTQFFSRHELANLLESSENMQSDSEESGIRIFHNALDFADRRVRDCMVSRVDMVSVDIDECSYENLVELFSSTNYSRIPVWKGSVDNIIGYVTSKSLFGEERSLKEMLVDISFVPETLPLHDMLKLFIKQGQNIAVVLDEFGGTSGIVSLEDVLEEIFGEIEDEHDTDDEVEKLQQDGSFIFSARLEIDYLNDKYSLHIPESEEYDTLAGYIIFKHGGLPKLGDEFTFDNLDVKILRMTRSRIEVVIVRKKDK
ncbi:MAG: HlyC/CorC family transporter [Alistipes sp.]|nr:HlyC/CorC family transporter [Candidatus Alistipes equi]